MTNAGVRFESNAAKKLQDLTTPPTAKKIPQNIAYEKAGHGESQDGGQIHLARSGRHSGGDKDRRRRDGQAAFLEQRRPKDHAVPILMKEGINVHERILLASSKLSRGLRGWSLEASPYPRLQMKLDF